MLAAQEHAGEVDGENTLPGREFGREDRHVTREQNSCVVDEDVHAAEPEIDLVVEPRDALLAGDVDRERLGLPAGRGDLRRDTARRFLADVGAGDASSLGGETERAGPADPAPGTGDRRMSSRLVFPSCSSSSFVVSVILRASSRQSEPTRFRGPEKCASIWSRPR